MPSNSTAIISKVVATGRSIKGRETFMVSAPSLRDDLHRGTVVQLVRALGDYLLALLHAIVENRRDVAGGRTGLDVAQTDLVAGIDHHKHEVALAAVLNRPGRHHGDLRQGVGLEPRIDELIGKQRLARVIELR